MSYEGIIIFSHPTCCFFFSSKKLSYLFPSSLPISPPIKVPRVLLVSSSIVMEEKSKNTALLVINMQNDCVLPASPNRVIGAHAIVPSVIKAVDFARENGILVVWVVNEHDPLGTNVELFRRHLYSEEKLGPLVKGSEGAELVDGLVIKEKDYKVVKNRFSAFFATNLHSYLQGTGIKNVVVAGVQTPNCIRQTAFEAVALDYQSVTVIVDATAAATPEVHAANVVDMKNVAIATPTLQEWFESNA